MGWNASKQTCVCFLQWNVMLHQRCRTQTWKGSWPGRMYLAIATESIEDKSVTKKPDIWPQKPCYIGGDTSVGATHQLRGWHTRWGWYFLFPCPAGKNSVELSRVLFSFQLAVFWRRHPDLHLPQVLQNVGIPHRNVPDRILGHHPEMQQWVLGHVTSSGLFQAARCCEQSRVAQLGSRCHHCCSRCCFRRCAT